MQSLSGAGRRITAALAAAMLVLPIAADGAKPTPGVYVVRGDGVLPAVVGGVAGRMRITPWAPSAPTLNPDYAQRIGLKGGWFGFRVLVGPVKVGGQTGVTRLAFGQTAFKRRVAWFEKRYDAGADGAIGPGGLPADLIRFDLRSPQPGERTVSLPLVQLLFRPTFARVDVGGRPITILFDPQHVHTLATAGAGAAIAAAQGGELVGPRGSAEIAFGIQRPIRTMRLKSPLMIGPMRIDTLAVRIADGGSGGAAIPDAEADPDEIVVTAKGKGDRRDVLIVGRDQLSRCSSILFDKRAKTISLSCT